MRDLLFPLLKNSKSEVDDHHLRITHTHSHLQDKRAKRAKGEEPLVILDDNVVLEPVRLHVKLHCEDKRGESI